MNMTPTLDPTTLITDRSGNVRTVMPDSTLGPVVHYGRAALVELFAATDGRVSWFGVPKEYNAELVKAMKEGRVVSKTAGQMYVWRSPLAGIAK